MIKLQDRVKLLGNNCEMIVIKIENGNALCEFMCEKNKKIQQWYFLDELYKVDEWVFNEKPN